MRTRRTGMLALTAMTVMLNLSGCAVDSLAAGGAAGAAQQRDAEAGAQQVGKAKLAAGQFTLAQVTQSAKLYARLHDGSTDGFAADLSATEPQLAGQLTAVDDQHAEISVPQVGCLTVTLPDGAPTTC